MYRVANLGIYWTPHLPNPCSLGNCAVYTLHSTNLNVHFTPCTVHFTAYSKYTMYPRYLWKCKLEKLCQSKALPESSQNWSVFLPSPRVSCEQNFYDLPSVFCPWLGLLKDSCWTWKQPLHCSLGWCNVYIIVQSIAMYCNVT